MAAGRRGGPLNSAALRGAAARARAAARAAAASRATEADEFPEAAMVARRVYVAATDAARTGVSGDVYGPLWACAAVAAEMMGQVIVTAHGLSADDEELREDVEAYLMAVFVSQGHGFDLAHFEQWRQLRDGAARVTDDAG